MPIASQLGVKKESTYGTAVTVDRFFEFNEEGIELKTGRVESKGLRTGQRVQRSDRFLPYKLGAEGSVSLDVLSKGFGFWLEHMLGSVATSGPTDSAYTHTATIGTLFGKSFTLQINRPLGAAGNTDQAYTWEGGKVSKWTLSCEKEGIITCEFELLFEDESTATGLATASYPTSAEVIGWNKSTLTIGGSSVPVTKWTISCDNKLKDDRHYLNNSTLRSEPVEIDYREISVDLECDWDSLTQYNRFASTTASGALAAVVMAGVGNTLIGASTYSSLTITCPAVRFDEVKTNVSGQDQMMQSIKGIAMYDGTNSAVTIAYVTADTTP